MRGFNQVMLYGNLTGDPEKIEGKLGKPFTVFSVAINRDWKNKEGEPQTETNFHKVVAFGKLGEVTSTYLHRGQPVLISGHLNNRSYLTKAGEKRYSTEVIMDDFHFVPSKKSTKGAKKSDAIIEPNEDLGDNTDL